MSRHSLRLRTALAALSLVAALLAPDRAAAQTRRWQVPISGQMVDVLEVLPGRGILVGGVDPEHSTLLSSSVVPDYRDLSLHDVDSGAQRWRFDRQKLGAAWIDILGFDPIVMAYTGADRRRSGHVVLDTSTGQELWRSNDHDWLRLVCGGRFALGLQSGMFSTQLVAVSLADGKALWSRPATKELPPAAVESFGDELYLLAQDITRLDPTNGKVQWTAALPGDRPESLRLKHSGAALLAFDATRLAAFDPGDGGRRWLWHTPQAVLTSVGLHGNTIVVYLRFADGWGMAALNGIDGKQLWAERESRRLTSPLLSLDERLCYTTDVFLACRDATSGRELLRTPLPYAFVHLDAAPRRLAQVGQRIVVAGEAAVAAWNFATGAWAFSDDHDARTYLPLALSSHSNAAPPSALRPASATARAAAAETPTSMLAYRPSDFHVWQAQRNLDFARSRTSMGTAAQRRDARAQTAMATQALSIAQSMQRSAERIEAIRGFGESLLGALEAIGNATRRASALDKAWGDAEGLRARDSMLQGRFHLRQKRYPAELQVIDIDNGSVAQLDFGMPLAQSLHSKVRSFVLLDDGSGLLSTAPHAQRSERKPIGQGKSDMGSFSLFQQYLTVFDLGSLQFKPHAGKRDAMWLSITDKLASGDMDKLRKELTTGDKLNVEKSMFSLHSTTPLMTAAYLGRIDALQWLLDQGANPDKTDRYGWKAIDYARAAGQTAAIELLSGRSTK